uniref:Chromo domain-containing protein n=1 Tax=Globodera pallida TaxID=36090 RepID=A0A183CE52_GLOPA
MPAKKNDISGSDGSGEEEKEEFEVERILAKRVTKNGRVEFKVHWKNYLDAHDSWEPQENLGGSKALLDEFLQRKGNKRENKKPTTSRTPVLLWHALLFDGIYLNDAGEMKFVVLRHEDKIRSLTYKEVKETDPRGLCDYLIGKVKFVKPKGEPPLASLAIPSGEQRQQILKQISDEFGLRFNALFAGPSIQPEVTFLWPLTDWNQFLWSVRGILSKFFFGLRCDRTTKHLAIDGARPMEEIPPIPVIEEPEDDDNDGEIGSGHSEDPSRFSVVVPHRDLPLEKLANALMLRLEIKKEHWLKVNRQLLTYAIMGKCSTVFK